MTDQKPDSPDKKEYQGSCHCKKITYTANLAISDTNPTTTRCNCSMCLKSGFTPMHMSPSDFKLLTPSSLDEVSSYKFRPDSTVTRYFCNNCGIQVLIEGSYKMQVDGKEQKIDLFGISLVTLEQTKENGLDLSKFKFEYWDGRNNNFYAGRKSSPWPNGIL